MPRVFLSRCMARERVLDGFCSVEVQALGIEARVCRIFAWVVQRVSLGATPHGASCSTPRTSLPPTPRDKGGLGREQWLWGRSRLLGQLGYEGCNGLRHPRQCLHLMSEAKGWLGGHR
ncbi:hypothetical protein B296_00023315 [Ensete ventricosum]|uniref:Uncharacterized protein n=1 Tax=Ensete ventricosum TaxID=4639 RepID=A0A427A6L6_ENSVE|nr:hypothetical protein B296_00023315 [Ensete ventricosum]